MNRKIYKVIIIIMVVLGSIIGTMYLIDLNRMDKGKAADKIMVAKLKLDTNVKFEIGERVKITCDGDIMETYPFQIKVIRYEEI